MLGTSESHESDRAVESHHQAPRTPTNGVTVHARLVHHVYENAGANAPNVFNQFGVFALQSPTTFPCPSNPPSAPESMNSLPPRVLSPLDEDYTRSVRGPPLDTAVLTNCLSIIDTQSNKKQHQANVDLGSSSEAGESDRETQLAPQSEASLDFLSRERNELFTGRVLPRIPPRVPPNSPARLRPNLRTLFG
jgi:hypothetical protein